MKQGKQYTREDIVKFFDSEVQKCVRNFGADDFWTKWAKERRASLLAAYDAGEVIPVESKDYIKDGIEYTDRYMSDGTVQTLNFGYYD